MYFQKSLVRTATFTTTAVPRIAALAKRPPTRRTATSTNVREQYPLSCLHGIEHNAYTLPGNVWHGSQEPWHNWDILAGRFVSEFGMYVALLHRCGRTTHAAHRGHREAYPNIRTVDHWLGGNKAERFPQSRYRIRAASSTFDRIDRDTSAQDHEQPQQGGRLRTSTRGTLSEMNAFSALSISATDPGSPAVPHGELQTRVRHGKVRDQNRTEGSLSRPFVTGRLLTPGLV